MNPSPASRVQPPMYRRSNIAAMEPPAPRSPTRLRLADLWRAVSAMVEQRTPPTAIVWAEARDGHRETRLFLFTPGPDTEVDTTDPAFDVARRRGEIAVEVGGRRILVALHSDRSVVELPPVPHPHHKTRRITVELGHTGLPFAFEFAVPVLVPGRAS